MSDSREWQAIVDAWASEALSSFILELSLRPVGSGTWGESDEFVTLVHAVEKLLTHEQRRGGSSSHAEDEVEEVVEVLREGAAGKDSTPLVLLSTLAEEFGSDIDTSLKGEKWDAKHPLPHIPDSVQLEGSLSTSTATPTASRPPSMDDFGVLSDSAASTAQFTLQTNTKVKIMVITNDVMLSYDFGASGGNRWRLHIPSPVLRQVHLGRFTVANVTSQYVLEEKKSVEAEDTPCSTKRPRRQLLGHQVNHCALYILSDIVELEPEAVTFATPLTLSTSIDVVHSSNLSWFMREAGDGAWERLVGGRFFCAKGAILCEITLRHFCHVAVGELDVPDRRISVVFEPWLQSAPAPSQSGGRVLKLLAFQKSCEACKAKAEMLRETFLDDELEQCLSFAESPCIHMQHGDTYSVSDASDSGCLERKEEWTFDSRSGPAERTLYTESLPGQTFFIKVEARHEEKVCDHCTLRIAVPRSVRTSMIVSTAGDRLRGQDAEMHAIKKVWGDFANVVHSQPKEKIIQQLLSCEAELLIYSGHADPRGLLVNWESAPTAKPLLHRQGNLFSDHLPETSLEATSATMPGEFLTPGELQDVLKDSPVCVRCVYLSCCHGDRFKDAVLDAGIESVIYWQGEFTTFDGLVEDFTKTFVKWCDESKRKEAHVDFRQAYFTTIGDMSKRWRWYRSQGVALDPPEFETRE